MTALTGRRLEAIYLTMADRLNEPGHGGIERRDVEGAIEWAQEKLTKKTVDLAHKYLPGSRVGDASFRGAYMRSKGGIWVVVLRYSEHDPETVEERVATGYEFDTVTLFRCFDGRATIDTVANIINKTNPAKVTGLRSP